MKTNKFKIVNRLLGLVAIMVSCNNSDMTVDKSFQSEKIDNSLSIDRILKDISKLDESKYKFFFNTDYYQDILKGASASDFSYSKYFQNDQCLIHFETLELFEFGPIEHDRLRNLLLFYSRNKEDTSSWYLDTVITTFPEFERIKESANYYQASTQRCVKGYCEWYHVILQIDGTQITEIYDNYSMVRSLRLEHYLADGNSPDLSEEPGDTIDHMKHIEKFNWEGMQLKSVLIENKIGILKEVLDDSLVLQTKTFNNLIEF